MIGKKNIYLFVYIQIISHDTLGNRGFLEVTRQMFKNGCEMTKS